MVRKKESLVIFCLSQRIVHRHGLCMLLPKLPGGAKVQWSKIVLLVKRNQRKELEVADSIGLVNN